MDFNDAIVEAMKAYYSGMTAKELNGASKKRSKYSKSYFDKVSRENNIEPFEYKKRRLGSGRQDT